MAYFNLKETEARIEKIREVLRKKSVDAALIYYDELNVANGWYLTGWCPQFEKGCVLLPVDGDPLLLGGPESEPFAKMSSAITETRNFTPFMVPDEEYPNAEISTFESLYKELDAAKIPMRTIGLVGTAALPHNIYTQFQAGFKNSKLIDITAEYEALRAHKSPWEIEQIRSAFSLTFEAFQAMKNIVAPGIFEHQVAAEGEYICRKAGAHSFAYGTIIGSGERAKAVVPTAYNKEMLAGELVMVGIAPRVNGYAGVMGESLPVSGTYTQRQKDCVNYLREAFHLTKDMLKPGVSGREIDVPARKSFIKNGLIDYLVCPFAHTIGLMEAEGPFYGPNSDDVLAPGMTVCIDVSFFGHPEFHGARIETGYVITETGCEPLSPEMDKIMMATV
ncbi:MAG: Xaa-Pro peptidase family protein [Sphaerochaetaceae bacterium]|jgi:Xaa-Pro aminopeptidase|nr:Xaa-Pro peptidase family protein [Sphaerochaetaceae bacterium]MDD4220410.1 Xaa-Pro peptidase family protein [Sphaerochaetaceae bacterium]MDY0371761.1 Xaa-Pro peptidase family protein [Sphaerochaetaceae bacterium]